MAGCASAAMLPGIGHAASNAALQAQMNRMMAQFQTLQQQNQQQIQSLQAQVQTLQSQLQANGQQPHIVTKNPAFAAAPNAKTSTGQPVLVVTQSPGNLPGRSSVAPYTSAGPGEIDGVPPVAAAPISSGGDRVKVSLSGQINRMEVYGDDGKASNFRNLDNNNSSSRIRLVGEGRIDPNTSAGVNLEMEIRPNSSASTSLTQDSSSSVNNFTSSAGSAANISGGTLTARDVEAYVQNKQWGGVRIGFGSTASYQTGQTDLSGTGVANYVGIGDFDGGFAFRQKGGARVPLGGSTAPGALTVLGDGTYGPAVASVFNFMDGLGRDDRLRYDSPVWNGFQLSASVVDGGAVDGAIRYAAKFGGNQFAAGFGIADASSINHSAATSYGYAGGAYNATTQQFANVSGGALTNGETIASTSVGGSTQYNGSASLLLANGLNFTVSAGGRDVKYTDPLGRNMSPFTVYGKVGYLHNFFPWGKTAISANFNETDDLIYAGDRARAYGGALVQNVDAAGLELYISGQYQTLDRDFANYYGMTVIGAGARVRF